MWTTLKCTCSVCFFGWHGEAAIRLMLKHLWERVMKGRKPRNVLFTAHVLYSLFMGNSFEFCSSLGPSGSEVTSPKQPVLLHIYTAVLDGRICLGAFYISCVSEGALCLGLRIFPASLTLTSCPCKASCKCIYRSSTIISNSSGWLTCQKLICFFRLLFLQVPLL